MLVNSIKIFLITTFIITIVENAVVLGQPDTFEKLR